MENLQFTQVGDNTDEFIFGDIETDILDGQAGDDYLFGDVGDDILFGGAGNDVVLGGQGSDFIIGEAGSDRLIGSDYQGNYFDFPELQQNPFAFANTPVDPTVYEIDTYNGGAGADIFVLGDYFNAHYRGQSFAVIEDFNSAEGDKLEVFGTIEDYSLGVADLTGNGVNDQVLQYQGDAIAYFFNLPQEITPQDLVSSQVF